MKDKKIVVFDLDDTLIKELHYLQSAYKDIASKVDKDRVGLYDEMFALYTSGENVFAWIIEQYPFVSLTQLLEWYRDHIPAISLTKGSESLLSFCKTEGFIVGLITDGRSLTQRNKLKAIGLDNYFDLLVISEEFGSTKPNEINYLAFDKFEGQKYYIADNTKKDFISPNKLGWTSICVLNDGLNIHPQDFNLDKEYLPQYKVDDLVEVIGILK